jgi:hypothetical protein
MRKRGRVDLTQKLIVEALRRSGCSVLILSNVGGGCPDLAVARRLSCLAECKSGSGKLTPDQVKFHEEWKGHIVILRTLEDALRLAEELM